MSLRGLARRCDLSPAHVSKVERGLASPSLEALTRIVNELDLHDADLFGRPDRPDRPDRRAHIVRATDAPILAGDHGGESRVAAQTPSVTVVLGNGGPERFPEPTISPWQVITVVLAGSVEVRIRNDLLQLQAGDTLVVPPLIEYAVRVTGGPETRTAHITSGRPQAGASA